MFFSRGKNKVQNPYGSQDLYKFYISTVEKNTPYDIDYKLYKSIISDYIRGVMDIIFSGTFFSMPGRMGELFVRKVKLNYSRPKRMPTDWVLTQKYNKRIIQLNEHTDGFKYKFHWMKMEVYSNNVILYKITMTRENKRRLAKILKETETDYIEM